MEEEQVRERGMGLVQSIRLNFMTEIKINKGKLKVQDAGSIISDKGG